MAVSGRAGPSRVGEPFIWGAAPAGAVPGFSPLRGTWRCGLQRGFGGAGDIGGAPETPGEFSAPQRRESGLAGSDPLPPLRLRSEDGFTPISPSMFPLSFARRADYYNSSVIHIPILTASRGPWRHGPPLSPPSPSLLSRRTPPSRRRR